MDRVKLENMEQAQDANRAQTNVLNARILIIAEHANPHIHSLMENVSSRHAIKENMGQCLNAYPAHLIAKTAILILTVQYAMMDSHY